MARLLYTKSDLSNTLLAIIDCALLHCKLGMFGETTNSDFPFSKIMTLDKINLSIIKQMPAQEHGNQSATAKRLSLSPATLWWMLKKRMGSPEVSGTDTKAYIHQSQHSVQP